MSSGVTLPSLLAVIATATSEAIVLSDTIKGPTSITVNSNGPWTPPQYSQPALTVLTVPATASTTTGQASSQSTAYVFDAVFRLLHRRTVHKTSHPVLTGANISDHAYIEPARVTLEIGMSDAMSSYSNGIWVGASTKSISAWQIIKGFQTNKTLINLTTRLDNYVNMLVIDAVAPDTNMTKYALRGTIILEELLSASVVSMPSQSARPQTTGSTSGGVIQSTPPSAGQLQQNMIPSPLYPSTPTYPSVPGAGNVSSNSLSQIAP
jgi:hypothetical protein